eukprot:364692-Chlamydomonas_euryale.AAC.21
MAAGALRIPHAVGVCAVGPRAKDFTHGVNTAKNCTCYPMLRAQAAGLRALAYSRSSFVTATSPLFDRPLS